MSHAQASVRKPDPAPLTEPAPSPGRGRIAELARTAVGRRRARLGRSLSIREVDAGSCNGCELEIHALNNAYYDIERFGCASSPRRAMPTCCWSPAR
jgi:hypothetical protein